MYLSEYFLRWLFWAISHHSVSCGYCSWLNCRQQILNQRYFDLTTSSRALPSGYSRLIIFTWRGVIDYHFRNRGTLRAISGPLFFTFKSIHIKYVIGYIIVIAIKNEVGKKQRLVAASSACSWKSLEIHTYRYVRIPLQDGVIYNKRWLTVLKYYSDNFGKATSSSHWRENAKCICSEVKMENWMERTSNM